MSQSNVLIILATYNGEKHIREQVSSIQSQTYCDWRLLIRDDCSMDKTPNIIQELAQHDERISIVDNKGINLGVIDNFGSLMEIGSELTNIDYVFFSDQDDVWDPEKIQLMINCFQQKEAELDEARPLLVHSDLSVVGEQLDEIHPSFMKYQSIRNEEADAWEVLCVQNYVTGCVMAINRSLLEFALPMPKNIVMHDWWLALCASVSGEIIYIDKPLIKYRQHQNNQVGAKGFWARINPLNSDFSDRWEKGRQDICLAIQQTKFVLQRMEQHDLNNEASHVLRQFSQILVYSRWKRLIVMLKYKIRRQNKLMSVLLYLRIFTT